MAGLSGLLIASAGLVVILVLALGASLGSAAFPGQNGVIALDTRGTGPKPSSAQIYTIRPDGSHLRTLTHYSGAHGCCVASEPAFSSNGKKIVFVRRRYSRCPHGTYFDSTDIATMNAGGSHVRRLLQGPKCHPPQYSSPSFSPSGKKIIFTTGRGISVVNADGSHAHKLTSGWGPVFSPNGRKIAFTRDVKHRYFVGGDIFVMNRRGNHVTRLTNTGTSENPSFSPDGNDIAFSSSSGISIMHADGSQAHKLCCANAHPGAPVFSPDGTKIAFLGGSRDRPSSAIFTVNADGSQAHRLRRIHTDTDKPDWQPLP